MGRAPCCSKVGLHRGPWTAREDALLIDYIQCHGEGNWRSLPKNAGLLRCPKSCRLRWMNYLRPDIKRGNIGPEEEDLIIRLHSLLGNRWSLIAGRLPGRTDNEIKNYWNSHLSKKLKKQGIEVREGNTKSFPKRSKSSQKKNEKQKKKLPIKERIEEDPKTIIHAPKPTRFTPNLRNMSSSSNNAPDWSQVSDRNVGSIASEGDIGDISWPDVDIEGDHGFQNNNFGLDSDFQYGLFDRVYQEYSQLLNTEVDQFPVDFLTAEPLLI